MSRLMANWAQSPEAQEYVAKASTSSASTPADGPPPQLTDAQKERRLKGYFKTHCFVAYGGSLWLKFLVATGDVDAEAVEAVNNICRLRTMERRNALPGDRPDPTPGNIFLRREDRASTPVADGYVPLKRRRAIAASKLVALYTSLSHGEVVDPADIAAAEKEVAEAEEASKASGFAFQDFAFQWHNCFASTQAGLFEMALKVLLVDLGCDLEEAHELTRQDHALGKGKDKGQGKGKGKGKGKKGDGGKGGGRRQQGGGGKGGGRRQR